MKAISVKVAGTVQDAIDLQIQSGTTTAEVLADLGLSGYLLSTGPNAKRFFGEDENIYLIVQDGDKLFASTKAEVGR